MIKTQSAPATLEDLYREPGKAELIAGRIVRFMVTGRKPNTVAGNIYVGLREYAKSVNQGEAHTDMMGYSVPLLSNGRQSFCPDVSYYVGPFPENEMRFIEGAPTLAVEVRSECDYAAGAGVAMTQKRTDYFEAGTQVVWDVDVLDECVHVYRIHQPAIRSTFVRGQNAVAEPALPGWTLSLDRIFE